MKILPLAFTILSLLASWFASGQHFMQPMNPEELILSKSAYAVTVQGDTIRGKIRMSNLTNGQLRSFTIRDDQKQKYKFKAKDVITLAVRPSVMSKLTSAFSIPTTWGKSGMIRFNDVLDREWVYFDRALLPRKKNKYALLQLVNPGFASKIKVYNDPRARKNTGLGMDGGGLLLGLEDRSFFVVFDNNKSQIYRQSSYNRNARNELYKDCPVFMENYSGERFNWRDFPEHVFVYDQLCD
ncbi:MAG: hypothetical protein RIC03_12140 [Cyclobacteriaceae bacterium]